MPLVISKKAQDKFYIENEEFLAEILGHSNFDGEDWAAQDIVVFENGTFSFIEPMEEFYVGLNQLRLTSKKF